MFEIGKMGRKRRKGSIGLDPIVDTQAKENPKSMFFEFLEGLAYYLYFKHRNLENMKVCLMHKIPVNILTLPFWIENGNLNLTKEDVLNLGLRKFQECKTGRWF